MLDGEELTLVDRSTYLGSCVTNDVRRAVEVSTRISEARAAYTGLNHWWRSPDISLEKIVYTVAVGPVLLFGCET